MQKFNKHLIVDIIFVIVVLALLVHLSVTSIRAYGEDDIIATVEPTESTQETEPEETNVDMAKETEPEETEETEPIETVAETVPEVIPEASTLPEPTETEPQVDQEALELLACVIYQEAGGDACCDDCRRRVADVVLNRVEHEGFPDTIYEVLTQQSQYGRYHWTGVVWPERSGSETEAAAVARAYRIAEEVLRGQHSELYGEGYIWQAEFRQGRDIVYHCGIYFGR